MRALLGIAVMMLGSALVAQTPQPFPSPPPRNTTPARTPPPPPPIIAPAPAPGPEPATAAPVAPAPQPAPDAPPDLGVPIYPTAVFLTSYDAGQGQRFYLFGVSLSYAEAVAYYRTTLKQRGEQLFESPPTHQFETERFREDRMAFPPSVTIKDFTFGGSAGYVNPIPGGTPERFPTIVQIVPAPRP